MGGVVDGGVGIGIKTSPRRAAIEKAQAELRQEYDVREERRRELEFLEKGGNPLDFKFGNVASLSLQSTSIADRHPEQFQSSEAKGSFALAASPHGDSVESSGRPGPTSVSGRKSTENPLLFDGESELLEGEKKSMQLGRKNNKNRITSSEQSSQMDGNRNTKESEDSAIFRPYARRNRTRTNRDGARLDSADGVHNRGGQGSSLASRASIRDAKGSSTETNSQKEKPKVVGINGDVVSRTATPESLLDGQIDGEQAPVSTTSLKQSGLPVDSLDIITKGSKENNRHKQPNGNCNTPDLACPGPELVFGGEGAVSVGADDLPVSTKARQIDSSGQLNGTSDLKRDNKTIGNEVDKSCEAFDRKSSHSSIHPSLGTDVKKDNICNDELKIGSNGNTEAQLSESENNKKLAGGEMVEREDNKIVQNHIIANPESHSAQQKEACNDAECMVEEETNSRSDLSMKAMDTSDAVKEEHEGQMGTENERKEMNDDGNSKIDRDSSCDVRPPLDLSSCEAPSTSLSGMKPDAPPDCQTSGNNLSMTDKAYEDSVLEEARIIQAKHKRIAELSGRTSPLENRQRCHWNFVLEEMAWLANDVAQERIWKMTAAAQLCHRIASLSRHRCEEKSRRGKLKLVAHNLAKAVMQFWHSAEVILNRDNPNLGSEAGQSESVGSQRSNSREVSGSKNKDPNMESSNKSMLQTPGISRKLPIQAYAVQYLRDSSPHVYKSQPQAPKTPDIASDVDMPEVSWDDHLTEESLFYTIPAGAMETYRRSIEVYVTECERTGSNVQEEVGTSIFSTVADQGYRENIYDEDEAETSAYYLAGPLEGSKSSKFAQKKRKNPRSYEQRGDLPYGHYTSATQPSTSLENKPANLSIGPIPAKRMRTANASRQRVLGPFGTGAHGNIQAQAKTEVSSGDTNSFHDDQSSLHGVSRIQKGIEVESAGEFEKHVSYDYAETSTKPKKKKKPKHLDSTFEPGWQLGSATLSEQRDPSKKRSEHFESNGTSGLDAQHNAKKPKIMKQSLDNSYDNIMSMSGSIPCPMASQMSNMSNQNKLMRYIGGRDRSRKSKALKASSLHSGPGSPWSLFEDQALVVLVHDMGPNWELVSDAINSTLQFKCIFRKPKECKERHKFLMDKSAGDGADSAEDSGSSQSYPSTLPGIPKGSARQLFQRLQGPVEEDTLKEHFDRIIYITQRQHHRTIQLKNESLDLKQIPVHNSHYVALSQVCPNNLNGVVLTPLDLVEATVSSPDVLPLSFQGSHASNLAMQNQGSSISSVLAASGVNSPVPGSPGFVLGNNMPPAGPLNAPMRDGRYSVPKTSPSPGDEPQRMQPHNQMLSTRTIAQSNLSIPGAVPGSDRGVRVLPGGNGLGMNRATMPMARPGFPGMASSPMLNSNSIISSSMVGAQSPANMHAGPVAAQGRPRESMHLARGGHNNEQQRQMPAQELPMHVTQGSAQGVPAFNGIGPTFSNQTTSTVQTYPGHPQQQQHQMSQQQPHAPNNPHHHHPQLQGTNHGTSSQQQQMYLRIAKERQLQQRYLQQQQFVASNNVMPHVQSPPQLPMSSPLQNSPQVQSQSPSQSASLPPLTPSSPMTPMASQQHQPKNQLAPHSHGFPRNPHTTVGGLSNQVGPKQRQRQAQQQQLQQSGRAHPQQRQQAESHQQQANFLKGIGRGNMVVHQKLQVDPSHLNGLSATPGSMGTEKEMMQQGQGLYSGTGINQVQPSKAPIPQAPHHSQLPSGPAAPHSKQHLQQQMSSHSENSAHGQFSAIPPGHNTSSAPHQAVPSTLMSTHMGQLQSQPQQNQVSQAQTVAQRMHPQNRQHMNYDQLQLKSQPEKAQAADQKLVNAMSPQAGIGAATSAATGAVDSAGKVARAASPVPQRKASEAGVTSIPSQVGTIGSKTLPGSVRGEQLQSVGQGVGQRSLAENLPHHGHNGGGAHGALAKQSSGPLPSSSQQHYLPQSQEQLEQAPTQQQAQPQPPQAQHLQATQGSLFIGPTNS